MSTRSAAGVKPGTMHRFYATVLRGEVSDAAIQGYLRAACQVEDLWQEVDDQLSALIKAGVPRWDAYHRLRYAILFIRAARAIQVFVKAL